MKYKKSILKLDKICFSYSDEPSINILENISLKLRKGEIIAILGDNSCGKTTLLNLIAGFLKPTKGSLIIRPDDKNFLNTSMVFQEDNLLKWKTLFHNIELAIISNINDKKQRTTMINNNINLLGISAYRNKLPCQLSGGIRQRTAIARALTPNPQILLLDEPFNKLDIKSKNKLIKDIKQILKNKEQSTILVSHDPEEAALFADRIVILDSAKKNITNMFLTKNKSRNKIIKKIKRCLY